MPRTGIRRGTGGRWFAACVVLVALLGLPFGAAESGADTRPTAPGAEGSDEGTGSGGGAAGPDEVLPPDGAWTVTLLTGEVVTVRSDADGRMTAQVVEHEEPFRTVRGDDGSLYVIPLAVSPWLGDVVDPELFNVTGLILQGYDDDSRDTIGLIVRHEPGTDVPATFDSPDEQRLTSIDAVAVEVPKDATDDLGDDIRAQGAGPGDETALFDGVTRMWLDRRMTTAWAEAPAPPTAPTPTAQVDPSLLDPNLTQVGADVAWEAGLTGDGVAVAVLDTGIDHEHPDIAGKVVAEANFSWSEDTVDRLGHGTHVAATAAGSGAGAAGARAGVAPDADLVIGKVLDDFGMGWESDVIEGMEWAAPRADVVNMSLGAQAASGDDPLTLAVDSLTEEHDTLFVVAAGNDGPLSGTIDTPGSAGRALTVGAVGFDDDLADFSGRGPTRDSYLLKPEITAPGVDIVAARAAEGLAWDPVDDHYHRLSGTSMAAPHVAGGAAILAQQNPDWGADELKSALVGSSTALDGDGYDVGAGRLDLVTGISTTLRADRGVVNALLPEPRTEPRSEAVAWTNHGDEPLTVDFDAHLTDRDGATVDGLTVEPELLTLEPGDVGSTTVHIDGPTLDRGLYAGRVTATATGDGGDSDVRLPVGVYAAPDMVELTIEATAPAAIPGEELRGFFVIANLDDFGEGHHIGGFWGDGVTVTVPAGRYAVVGDVFVGDDVTKVVAQVGEPDITITDDTTVAFDGAAARPFHPTVDGVDTAPPTNSSSALTISPATGTAGYGLITTVHSWYPDPPVHVTAMEADTEVFEAVQVFRLQAPHLTATTSGQPLDVTGVPDRDPAEGTHTLRAVDAGDGSDLTDLAGQLAVVRFPEQSWEAGEIVERAAAADVGLLAFVDEQRPHLGLDSWGWADVPMVAATGDGAEDLLAAAAAEDEVVVTVAASPYVYDIETDPLPRVEVDPVVDRAAQDRLATLDEHFHRDRDGTGPTYDTRYHEPTLIGLDSLGPLPERRTAHVTPDVAWTSLVGGPGWLGDWNEMYPFTALSMDAGATYRAGEEHTLTWLRRPQWPAPMGDVGSGISGCQPTPVERTADRLDVWLTPYQDSFNRFSCADPVTAQMTLERDGQVVDDVDLWYGQFSVPADAAGYTLTYEQEGRAPYEHRSHSRWTFRSAAPTDADTAPIPLLVAEWELPLDTTNRPTGQVAGLTVRHVTGEERQRILPPRVWTSVDDGDSWQRAPVVPDRRGGFDVRLPEVDEGTAVALRVDARDSGRNRVEQTLYDAYTG